MNDPNMPAGCLGPSDLDHYAALGHEEPQCPGCKQAQAECECCPHCGASPSQACEPSCGRGDYINVAETEEERNERLAEARYVDADLDGCSLEDWQAYQNDHRYKAELPFADWIQQFEEKK